MIKRKNLYTALTAILFFRCAHAAEEQKQTETTLTKGLSALSIFLEQEGENLRTNTLNRDRVYDSNRLYWGIVDQLTHPQEHWLPAHKIETLSSCDARVELSPHGDSYVVTHEDKERTDVYELATDGVKKIFSLPHKNYPTNLTPRSSFKPQYNPSVNNQGARQLILDSAPYSFSVIDLNEKAITKTVDYGKLILGVRFCRGMLIVRGNEDHTLYDTSTWEKQVTLPTQTWGDIFIDQSSTLAINCDTNLPTTQIWDLATAQIRHDLNFCRPPDQECFTQNNELIVLNDHPKQGRAIEIYNPQTKKLMRRYPMSQYDRKPPEEPAEKMSDFCDDGGEPKVVQIYRDLRLFNFNSHSNRIAIALAGNKPHVYLIDSENGTTKSIAASPKAWLFSKDGHFLITLTHGDCRDNSADETETYEDRHDNSTIAIYETDTATQLLAIPLPGYISSAELTADSFGDERFLKATVRPANRWPAEEVWILSLIRPETSAWFKGTINDAQLSLLNKARRHYQNNTRSTTKPTLEVDTEELAGYENMPTGLKETMAALVTLKSTLSEKAEALATPGK